jgi:hypothetical protein
MKCIGHGANEKVPKPPSTKCTTKLQHGICYKLRQGNVKTHVFFQPFWCLCFDLLNINTFAKQNIWINNIKHY